MTLLVYITESCKTDARHHTLLDDLYRFKDKVEHSQSTSQFDPFPPPYLVKKKLGGRQGRLIADHRKHGDHAVIVFLAIMIRGDKSYENGFSADPIAYGHQYFSNLVSDEELADYVDKRTRIEPPPAKPQPSEHEFEFLYNAFAHRQGKEEDMVYETMEWKYAVTSEKVATQLVRFAEPCLKALEIVEQGFHRLDLPQKPGWGLWVYKSQGCLLLVTPITDVTSCDADEVAERYRRQLEDGNLANVIRSSLRAYPAYMLADEEIWVEIEKEPVANMALSPEESDVLLSARRPGGAFPLFINGRAGSGKSTILQYLFADLIFYYLTSPAADTIAPPVYLTVNGELLRVARNFVERILRTEAFFRENCRENLVENNREILSEAFREFQPHLLSLIARPERSDRFAPSRRIGYSQFRSLWAEWFGMDRAAAREFGPDISWHVIRTYIKGMLSETMMDPDDYVQLPENQITVTRQTFQSVYERVWKGRYSEISEAKGYWDDQDLARFVLENDLAKPTYPALLCDEAQDFTRIELELLLRLNLYSGRAVKPHDLGHVPFVFAGDQFQTLNPTGFRWDAIKASFVEKFINALDPSGRSGRTELNYRELQYNYRSTPPIVQFSNSVQALRSALFKIPELKPQIPWSFMKSSFPVIWFDAADSAFWKKFRETDSIVVVVPCNEDEEEQFVRNNPVLRQHIRIEDGVPQNVLSAMRAKGREYKVVVVYGFSAEAPFNPVEFLEAERLTEWEMLDKSLPFQYFINRLYVAVSRPKDRLIIVDSEDGIKTLWGFVNQEEITQRVLDLANRGRDIWTCDPEDHSVPATGGMTMGKAEDLTREGAGDPIENARAFEEDGIARRDAFLLRQATLAYRNAGEARKATECRARALELEEKYFEAAQAYREAAMEVPEAIRCYWKSGSKGWQQLAEIGKRNATLARETEVKFALAIIEKNWPKSKAVELLKELVARISNPEFLSYVILEKKWQDGVSAIAEFAQTDSSQATLIALEGVLEALEARSILQSDGLMAKIHYAAGNLRKAVLRWEKSGDTKSDAYLKAKAAIEPYPGKLLHLYKASAIDDVIKEFEAHSGVPLEREMWRMVSSAYLQKNICEKAYEAAWEARDAVSMRDIAVSAVGSHDPDVAVRAVHGAIIVMVEKGEWETLVEFSSTGELPANQGWSGEGLRNLAREHTFDLHLTLVRALARSEKFPGLPGHLQRQLSEFLRKLLMGDDRQWQSKVSWREAGAAIERGGRFTDGLAFYEAVGRKRDLTEDERKEVWLRWIICKHRQRSFEIERGSKQQRIAAVELDISKKVRAQRLEGVTDIAQYPALQPISIPQTDATIAKTLGLQSEPAVVGSDHLLELPQPTESTELIDGRLPDRIVVRLGDYILDISRAVGRCNVEHRPTMETAYINLRERQFGGEKSWHPLSATEWLCDEWGLRVTIDKDLISFDSRGLGVNLSIKNPLRD